jgi:hypothetical protein
MRFGADGGKTPLLHREIVAIRPDIGFAAWGTTVAPRFNPPSPKRYRGRRSVIMI